jgi:hypothetical protein
MFLKTFEMCMKLAMLRQNYIPECLCVYMYVGGGEGQGVFDVCWLRHYATSRKVACSIPDKVIDFFSTSLIFLAALWSWG